MKPVEISLLKKHQAEIYRMIIDMVIRVQVESEDLPIEERLECLLNIRKRLCDDFKLFFGEYYPVYTKKICETKYGPYNEDSFKHFRELGL